VAQEIAGPGNQEESWNNNCAEVIGPAIGAEPRNRKGKYCLSAQKLGNCE